MIKALLDFIWAFKNHTEPYSIVFYIAFYNELIVKTSKNFFRFVRNSILFALTLILLVIPNNLMLVTANNYLIEMKYWLESNYYI